MAFRLKQNERVADGLRRIAREQAAQASDVGAEKVAGDDAAKSVHEARTRCKKLRGLLRLVRPRLGEFYSRENAFLREASRRLSAARDAAVLVATFDDVTRKCEIDPESLSHVRDALVEPSQGGTDIDEAARLGAFRQSMGTFLDRIEEWPVTGDDFAVVEPGLLETYRRGRKAMKHARKTGTDIAWHDWRKRAKDHWYHIRLLRNVWKPVLKAREAELDALSDLLGEDHDLAVLDAKLRGLEGIEESHLQPIVHRIEGRRAELKATAERLGDRLYAETPKAFRKRMKRYWKAWRATP